MKKTVKTTVAWRFPTSVTKGYTDTRLFVKDDKGREYVLANIEISSMFYPHPAGRCASVVVSVVGEHGEESHTHAVLRLVWDGVTDEVQRRNQREYGYLKVTSSMFPDLVGHDGRAYSVQWKLLPNEEFLDGAIRIGAEILTKTGVTGRYPCFRTKWMLGQFDVTQKTFVEVKDDIVGANLRTTWKPIEYYLRRKHGLEE